MTALLRPARDMKRLGRGTVHRVRLVTTGLRAHGDKLAEAHRWVSSSPECHGYVCPTQGIVADPESVRSGTAIRAALESDETRFHTTWLFTDEQTALLFKLRFG